MDAHCRSTPCGAALRRPSPWASRSLRDDVQELTTYTKAIAAPDPELARKYSLEVKRLSEAEGAGHESVPSHGAFRTDQFMIQDGELVLIDLDGYCWAEPSRDIGNLLAYIGWKAMRQPEYGHFVEQAADQFLQGYASVREPPDAVADCAIRGRVEAQDWGTALPKPVLARMAARSAPG